MINEAMFSSNTAEWATPQAFFDELNKEFDFTLDPFAGSGSTAVAAYRLQRDYIGFEIDDEYYEAGNRWLAAVRSQLSIFDLL